MYATQNRIDRGRRGFPFNGIILEGGRPSGNLEEARGLGG
jgi:hypothetical protein